MTGEKRVGRKAKKKPIYRKGTVIGGLLGALGAIVAALIIIFKPESSPVSPSLVNEVTNTSAQLPNNPGVTVNQNVSVEQNGASAQASIHPDSGRRRSEQPAAPPRAAVPRETPSPVVAAAVPAAQPQAGAQDIKCADSISTNNQSGNSHAGCDIVVN